MFASRTDASLIGEYVRMQGSDFKDFDGMVSWLDAISAELASRGLSNKAAAALADCENCPSCERFGAPVKGCTH